MSKFSWEILNDDPPKGSILIEYSDIYDGGLFWYDPEERVAIKRWNETFYRERCPDINEVMRAFVRMKTKGEP